MGFKHQLTPGLKTILTTRVETTSIAGGGPHCINGAVMVVITLVSGAYKPTYNILQSLGAPHCSYLNQMVNGGCGDTFR